MASPSPTTSPSTLAQLKTFFEQQIQSNAHVTIDASSLSIPGLGPLLTQTVGSSVTVESVTLALATDSLALSGVVGFLDTAFHLALTFTAPNGTLQMSFDALQTTGTSLSLSRLVSKIVPGSFAAAPALAVAGVHISFQTGTPSFVVGASTAQPWQIPLGVNQPSIQATVVLTQDSATLSGSLSIGTATFAVTYNLKSKAQSLSGSWTDSAHPLGWNSIVTALGLSPSVSLPANIPSAGFNAAQFSLDFSTLTFSLTGQTANGAAFLIAQKNSGSWGFAFGAAVAGNWQFSQISSDLKVLDFLAFQQAYLIISSFTQAQFTFPNFAPMTTAIDIAPGLNFGANINFGSGTSALAAAVKGIVGQSTAAVEGVIGSAANTRLSASLGGSMTLPHSPLKLVNPEFIVIASGPTVEVQGTLEIALRNQVIDVTGRLGISPESADFAVDVKGKSLLAPLGFTGVKLEEIGVSLSVKFEPPGIALGAEAIFQIGNTAADKCAFQLEVLPEAVNPILLYGQFSSLSLPTVFDAMFPNIKLPAILQKVGFQNVFVYYCEQPTTLPDNTAVIPGFAFNGTLDAYVFTMAAALKIDFGSGVSGSAQMTLIHLKGLDVTGADPTKGPAVQFNTISSPFFHVTLNVNLLQVVGLQVNGTITDTGFTFLLKFDVENVLNETLTCTFTNYHNFFASTDLHFHIKLDVGPFKAPKTNINLGTIHIDTQFTGHMDLTVNDFTVSGHVNGVFDGRQLPQLSFDANIGSLKKIPDLVLTQIKTFAQDIYSDVLGDGKKWAGMVATGAITGADDSAKVLTSVYGLSKDEAESILKGLRLHANSTVHVDATSPHVDTPTAHVDTAAVHADHGGTHVDVPRSHVDTSVPHVDGSLFGKHGDTGGHADQTATPHGDSTPHIDASTIPHLDSTTPHGDTKAHIDQSEHVDI